MPDDDAAGGDAEGVTGAAAGAEVRAWDLGPVPAPWRRWWTRAVRSVLGSAAAGAAPGTTDELPNPFSDWSVVPWWRLGA